MNELSLIDIFRALLRRLWLIVIVAAVFGVLAFLYTSILVDPVYSTKSSIIISNGGVVSENDNIIIENGKVQSGDITASAYLRETCMDIMGTKEMCALVAEKSGLKYSAAQIQKMVSFRSRSDDSLFIDITVSGTNRDNIVTIANTFANCSKDFVKETLPSAYISPMEYATSTRKVSPRIAFSTMLAVVFGAFVVIAPILFIAFTDNTIKGEDDFKNKYDITVLGVVPDFNYTQKGGYQKNG